ncbi:hypothetical protein QZN08_03835 [Burkholderia multivorans]|nr:hypothetical protein [Burkholderia multivorans]
MSNDLKPPVEQHEAAPIHEPTIPDELHPDTAKLVRRFARALANKLLAAQRKYGYSDNWMRDGWADECRAELMRHIHKGDPRDVAAYCAFLWHHNESTAPAPADEQPASAPIDTPTDREFALSAAICVHPKGVYGDEGGSMCCPITHTRDASFAPSPADERAAFESLKGAWQSMPPFDVFCAGWQAARAASANETGAEGAEPMAIPAGWKLVPVAPTFEMCRAMEEAIDAGWKDSIVWARGIAAAPQPPAQADAREPKIDAQPEGGEIAESLVPQGEVARSGGAREGLTDAQREAIEYAARWLEENVSNRYAYTAANQLRALLEGDKHE